MSNFINKFITCWNNSDVDELRRTGSPAGSASSVTPMYYLLESLLKPSCLPDIGIIITVNDIDFLEIIVTYSQLNIGFIAYINIWAHADSL